MEEKQMPLSANPISDEECEQIVGGTGDDPDSLPDHPEIPLNPPPP